MEDIWGFAGDDSDDDNLPTTRAGDVEDDDDNDNDDVLLTKHIGAHHCLVLLDCNPSMFDSTALPDPNFPKDTISPIDWSLLACEQIVRQRLKTVILHKTGKRDSFGLLLYNTRYRSRVNTVTGEEEYQDKKKEKDNKKVKKEEENDNDDDMDDEMDDDDDDDDNGENDAGGDNDNTTYHEFICLEQPGSSTIKTIQKALPDFFSMNDEDDREINLETIYGHNHTKTNKKKNTNDEDGPSSFDDEDDDEFASSSGPTPLELALFGAREIFNKATFIHKNKRNATNNDTTTVTGGTDERDIKQIWILTNDDDPIGKQLCGSGSGDNINQEEIANNLFELVKRTANDCHENGIEIYVWPLMKVVVGNDATKQQQPFDYSIFYDRLGHKIVKTPAKKMMTTDTDDTNEEEAATAATAMEIDENDDNDNNNTNNNKSGNNNSGGGGLDIDEMIEHMQGSWKKTRHTFHLPLLLPDWQQQQQQQRDDPDEEEEDDDDNDEQAAANAPVQSQSSVISNKSASQSQSQLSRRQHHHLGIGLDWYRLIQEATEQQTNLIIHRESGVLLNKLRQTMLKTEPEILTDQDVRTRSRTYVTYGPRQMKRLHMTPKDVELIKRNSNIVPEDLQPCCVLLGFKPADSIPFTYSLGKPYFVYPSEEYVEGSVSTFAHLHASMIRKQVLAVCELVTKPRGYGGTGGGDSSNTNNTKKIISPPKLVAMWPVEQEPVYDGETGDYLTTRPPGMYVVELPYEDDMKEGTMSGLRTEEEPVAEQVLEALAENDGELVDATIAMIDKLTRDDVVIGNGGNGFGDFENAQISKYWDNIERIILPKSSMMMMNKNRDKSKKKKSNNSDAEKYDTIRNNEEIMKRAGDEIEAWKALLPEDVEIKKEKKKRELPPDDSGIDWETEFWDNNLDAYNVTQLKIYLRSRGLPLAGRKADVVARVSNHLEKEIVAKKKKAKAEEED